MMVSDDSYCQDYCSLMVSEDIGGLPGIKPVIKILVTLEVEPTYVNTEEK